MPETDGSGNRNAGFGQNFESPEFPGDFFCPVKWGKKSLNSLEMRWNYYLCRYKDSIAFIQIRI